MVPSLVQSENVNVLISNANWAWPQAVEEIFQPRGVNALVADSGGDMVQLVNHNKIHLAILDTALEELSGMQTLRLIRKQDNLLPCILVAQQVDKRLLAEALVLQVFSVVAKPVDLALLAEQIDRLFVKHYASDIFSFKGRAGTGAKCRPRARGKWFSMVMKRTFNKDERSEN